MGFGLKTTFVAALTLGGVAVGGLGLAGAASAMPATGLQHALATSADGGASVEAVRLICPPYRPCFYVPGYRAYGYRPYYRPYGYGYGYGRPFYHRRFFY